MKVKYKMGSQFDRSKISINPVRKSNFVSFLIVADYCIVLQKTNEESKRTLREFSSACVLIKPEPKTEQSLLSHGLIQIYRLLVKSSTEAVCSALWHALGSEPV